MRFGEGFTLGSRLKENFECLASLVALHFISTSSHILPLSLTTHVQRSNTLLFDRLTKHAIEARPITLDNLSTWDRMVETMAVVVVQGILMGTMTIPEAIPVPHTEVETTLHPIPPGMISTV